LAVTKKVKLATLGLLKSFGLFDALAKTEWRKNRLLILGYHGVSLDDEHLWNPELYVSPEHFRDRMTTLKEYGCNVLPLAEALQKLTDGALPPRSVVLTFDDGSYDFFQQAFPVIRELGWPVTVYLTSYYAGYNRPVFDVMCSYLLWKGGGRVVDASGVVSGPKRFDLSCAEGRAAATTAIKSFAREMKYSARDKDALLTRLAERLRLDYQAILSKRILHLLSPAELAELAAAGVDIQLHTHRHYSPKQRGLFQSELEENRLFIERFSSPPRHFCYPSGVYEPRSSAWLRELGVASAATTQPGLAAQGTDRYELPRLIDTSSLDAVELEGWLCGLAGLLPRRPVQVGALFPPFYY
jgi:peptidoglycan/xylan/chitin deacetylase (PgdA/CDA1 family)